MFSNFKINDFNKNTEYNQISGEKDLNKIYNIFQNSLNKDYSLKLEEMWFNLLNYREEINENIKNKKKIKYEDFKKSLFTQLEQLIIELLYIDNPKTKKEKVLEIYNWYKDKTNTFYSLSNIQEKSYGNENLSILPNQSIQEEKINHSLDEDSLKNNPHRSQLIQYVPIKNFKLKKLNLFKNQKSKNIHKIDNDKNIKTEINQIPKPRKSNKIIKYLFSSGSKFYTIKKKKKEKFSFSQEKNKEEKLPNKELKTSYSYYIPEFSITQANIEKNILENKQKSIAKKRNLEEIKLGIKEYGKRKSIFLSDINKNYELRDYILDNIKQNKTISFSEDKINNISFPQKERAFPIKSKTIKFHSTKRLKKISKFIHGNSELITNEEKLFFKSPKVKTNNIKNIDNITKEILPSFEEKIININFTLSKSKSFNELLKYYKETKENIPNDSIVHITDNDPILKVRHIYGKLLNVNEIGDIKENKIGKQNLSIYDLSNQNEKKEINNSHNNINSVKSYLKRNNSSFSNYLNLRKLMENYQMKEFHNLTHSSSENKINKNIILKAFVNPTTKNCYPKLFLPKPVNNLLSKPFDKDSKKYKKN